VGHIWVGSKPRVGHIKPRDLAGVIKEETKVSGGKGQVKNRVCGSKGA